METADVKKYKLTESQLQLLRKMREEKGLAAEKVSEKLVKSKAWLAQLERGRYAGIKEVDLANLLAVLYDKDVSAIKDEGILESFLSWSVQDTCIQEWHAHKAWIPWEYHFKKKQRDFKSNALHAAESMSLALQEYIKNTDDFKTRYILWRVCMTMNRNLRDDPDLFFLLNGIEFRLLKNLDSDQRAIEKKMLLSIFDRFQQLKSMNIRDKHFEMEEIQESDILEEGISLIAGFSNMLCGVLAGADLTDEQIEEYNLGINRLNECSIAFDFSKILLQEIDREKLTRKMITSIFIPQLQSVMLDYNRRVSEKDK